MKKLMKLLLLVGILAYFGLLPFHGADIRELVPARTVIVTRSGDQYEVDVGAGVRGIGKTLEEALASLKERVTGVLFVQTANQVVIKDPETLPDVTSSAAFRPGASVYLTRDDPDPEALADWLEERPAGLTLTRCRALQAQGEQPDLPLLAVVDDGFCVVADDDHIVHSAEPQKQWAVGNIDD